MICICSEMITQSGFLNESNLHEDRMPVDCQQKTLFFHIKDFYKFLIYYHVFQRNARCTFRGAELMLGTNIMWRLSSITTSTA